MSAWIRDLPKAELHVHLDGIICPEMLEAILAQQPDYPLQMQDFDGLYPVENYKQFWKWWRVIDPIEGRLANFAPVLRLHLENLARQNVSYAEIMIANGELPADHGEAIEQVSALREQAEAQSAGRVEFAFLVAFGRNRPVEVVEQIGERILALHKAGLVVGAALAGPEVGYPVRPFRPVFEKLHAAGLGLEIHAGEWAGPESVWDALENGFPDRIGHGVSLFQDPKLVERFQAEKIHIEMCPSSNLCSGSVKRIKEHPIIQARRLELNYSINTDDPGVFESSLESEYGLLADVLNFKEAEFRRVYENTLQARFGQR